VATSAVDLKDVEKSFGATRAVDKLSCAIERGEMFGVIGPDGAGKTTTLRLICGLLAPDAGTVSLMGVNPFSNHRAATTSIGYVSQRFSLYGDLSIDENIAFFATIHGVHDFAERRERLLDQMGLKPFRRRLADRLSGGMKQKLALACVLVHEPPILVLDEPTTGVDPVSRREFWKQLAEFHARGLTLVLATPYLDEAERCGRVVLLNEGKLLALDTPEHLQKSMSGAILEVVARPARQALTVLRTALGADRAQIFGDRVHVRVDDPRVASDLAARLAAAGIQEPSIRPIVPTLEDVFIERLAAARVAAGPDK